MASTEQVGDLVVTLEMDDTDFSSKLGQVEAQTQQAAASMQSSAASANIMQGGMDNAAGGADRLQTGLARASARMGAAAVGMGPFGRVLSMLSVQSDKLAASLSVVGAGIAGWQIGRWISQIRVAGDTIENHLTAKLYKLMGGISPEEMAATEASRLKNKSARMAGDQQRAIEEARKFGQQKALAEAQGEEEVMRQELKRLLEARKGMRGEELIKSYEKEQELVANISEAETKRRAEQKLAEGEPPDKRAPEWMGLADLAKKGTELANERKKEERDEKRNKLLEAIKTTIEEKDNSPLG